ncbi:unnamed protein product [Amoebophrya sp. A120]|nr:unnamed protein product [Amoebophrya sp. A120]|eukprot:GSA120T00021290001.1
MGFKQEQSDFYVESETRLFIGAMGPNIKEEQLREHFSKFGAITECNLKADLASGKSKGYAFLSFEDSSAIVEVLKPENVPHTLVDDAGQEKILDVKRAKEIAETEETSTQKIFVGALPETCTSDKLRAYFGKYGAITAAVVITDHETNHSRGFGFVNFRNSDSVVKCLEDYHEHFIDEKWVETKCCLPRDGRKGGQYNNSDNYYYGSADNFDNSYSYYGSAGGGQGSSNGSYGKGGQKKGSQGGGYKSMGKSGGAGHKSSGGYYGGKGSGKMSSYNGADYGGKMKGGQQHNYNNFYNNQAMQQQNAAQYMAAMQQHHHAGGAPNMQMLNQMLLTMNPFLAAAAPGSFDVNALNVNPMQLQMQMQLAQQLQQANSSLQQAEAAYGAGFGGAGGPAGGIPTGYEQWASPVLSHTGSYEEYGNYGAAAYQQSGSNQSGGADGGSAGGQYGGGSAAGGGATYYQAQ